MRRVEQGFTLIEIMIVVAIVGILAAIAIPMFGSNVAKAKASEAQLQLNQLAKNAKTYFQNVSKYPQGSAGVLPGPDGGACTAPGKKFPVNAAAWSGDPVWLELDFHIDEPNLFSYHYDSASMTAATATAVGDLDCDGTRITYTLRLSVPAGTPASEIVVPTNAD